MQPRASLTLAYGRTKLLNALRGTDAAHGLVMRAVSVKFTVDAITPSDMVSLFARSQLGMFLNKKEEASATAAFTSCQQTNPPVANTGVRRSAANLALEPGARFGWPWHRVRGTSTPITRAEIGFSCTDGCRPNEEEGGEKPERRHGAEDDELARPTLNDNLDNGLDDRADLRTGPAAALLEWKGHHRSQQTIFL